MLHFPAMGLQLLVLDKYYPHQPNKHQDSFARQIPFLVSGNVLVEKNSCKVRVCMRDKPLRAGSSFFICLFFMSRNSQSASINKCYNCE